ncbi:mitochondrial ribosomal subunit S27-domain-containing protein [Podospora aff. communis PSN243]|uniref:Small ribosomal subunit protein mS33 n=1 Tax=Podospora aff. communis PSN243 TaxID=3040156 RepID=A0AAV9H6R1_9PEZI|nr:mitochondrial ribosomal subunit S27-domain-containing protein [Podospora aff. communis PSN243]
MSVPRARMLDLMKAQCQLFSTTFNPEGLRLGNKVLRKRLLGPTYVSWYPPKLVTHKDILREFAPLQLTVDDQKEDVRRDHIAGLKFRGKSAPKKIRTAPDAHAKNKKKK